MQQLQNNAPGPFQKFMLNDNIFYKQVFCLVLLETGQRWPTSGNTILFEFNFSKIWHLEQTFGKVCKIF